MVYKYNFIGTQPHSFVYILLHTGEGMIGTKRKYHPVSPQTSVSTIPSPVYGTKKILLIYNMNNL